MSARPARADERYCYDLWRALLGKSCTEFAVIRRIQAKKNALRFSERKRGKLTKNRYHSTQISYITFYAITWKDETLRHTSMAIRSVTGHQRYADIVIGATSKHSSPPISNTTA